MKLIKNLWKSNLIKGSFILFLFINFYNFLNFVFHSVSSRMLGPADYGVLAALMGMIYMFSVLSSSIQTVVSKFTTKFKKPEKLKNLVSVSIKKFLLFVAVPAFISFIIIYIMFRNSLNIDDLLIVLIGSTIFLYTLLPITRGILQSEKRFASLGGNFVIEGVIKLIGTILFVWIGWQVYGAVTAIIISLIIAFLFSIASIKKTLKSKSKEGEVEGLFSYSLPTLISIACVAVFHSVDVILARMFFDEVTAGIYGVISLLGKIIFFATAPIAAQAMFPIACEKHENKENSRGILIKTLAMVGVLSIAGIFVLYLFPELIINIFSGPKYLSLAHLLIYPGIAMSLLALVNVFVFYNLSTDKKKFNYILIVFVVLEIILLSIFNSTINQFICVMILMKLFMIAVFSIESLFSNGYFKSKKS